MQESTVTVEKQPLPADLAQPLELSVAAVKENFLVPVPDAASEDDPLRATARTMVGRLVNITPDKYDQAKAAIDNAGAAVYQSASHRSEMLLGKLGDLKSRSEDGGPVATALISLRDEVSKLDPSGVQFTLGWWARSFGWIPIVGNPVRDYFNQYETGQGAIDSTIKSLQSGRAMLENDNRILGADQKAWRQNTKTLQQQIAYLKAIDLELETAIPGVQNVEHKTFLQEEVLFPLRQRNKDLLQRLAVNQQGVIVAEVLIRNNRELIRGVDRALFVTVDALNIAVAAAMALANQKLVLDAVDALNTTTNTLIAGTARRLKTQGVEIQKRASSTTLDSAVLKQAFADIVTALDDISTFRREALPQMAQTIIELNQESEQAEEAIARMERGNTVTQENEFLLDVEAAPEAA